MTSAVGMETLGQVPWGTFKAAVDISVRQRSLRRACQVFISADLCNRVADVPTADGTAVIKTVNKNTNTDVTGLYNQILTELIW